MKKRQARKILTVTSLIGLVGFATAANNFGESGSYYTQNYGVIGAGAMDDDGQKPRLINTIQNVINRVLGILGLIALLLCLWGGFQMLTAAGDDSKVKTGTKVLKHAAIGLAVIGLSWLLVTFIFYLINRTADGTGTGGGGGGGEG